MTKEEVTKASSDKFDKIRDLMAKLQVTITPEEVVTEDGFIKKVLFWNDNEQYTADA